MVRKGYLTEKCITTVFGISFSASVLIVYCLHAGCPLLWVWMIGHGYCIDATNIASCNFNQDCCGPNPNVDYCQDCICYEDLNCNSPLELIGNGFCNDQTNNAECNFDGGDCCGSCANIEQCSECQCLVGSPPNYLCKRVIRKN